VAPKHYYDAPQDAVDAFARLLNEELSAKVKSLLEDKHLYQNVAVEPRAVYNRIKERVTPGYEDWVANEINKLLRSRLPLTTGSLELLPLLVGRAQKPSPVLGLSLPNVRLYCRSSQCSDRDERQLFRPVWYQDSSNELVKLSSAEGHIQLKFDTSVIQLLFIALQCQHCSAAPEGFLIRRENWKFSLDGRSPMEHIVIPNFIPKKEASLYRDAKIAWQSGKNLAAVFYLRTFLEQFARRQTGKIGTKETGQGIMDAYADTIPQKQRDAMPSLREWYEKLSEPIHAADEEAAKALFDNAREAVERHLDFRRLFKIPEVATEPDSAKEKQPTEPGVHS